MTTTHASPSGDIEIEMPMQVEHQSGCSCRGRNADGPAWMRDERMLMSRNLPPGVDALLAGSLLMAFQRAAEESGQPVMSVREERQNAAGEPIGPRLEMRSCEAHQFELLLRRVGRLVETSRS